MPNIKATNAVTGASTIANVQMLHFEGIYNKLDDNVAKFKFSE